MRWRGLSSPQFFPSPRHRGPGSRYTSNKVNAIQTPRPPCAATIASRESAPRGATSAAIASRELSGSGLAALGTQMAPLRRNFGPAPLHAWADGGSQRWIRPCFIHPIPLLPFAALLDLGRGFRVGFVSAVQILGCVLGFKIGLATARVDSIAVRYVQIRINLPLIG